MSTTNIQDHLTTRAETAQGNSFVSDDRTTTAVRGIGTKKSYVWLQDVDVEITALRGELADIQAKLRFEGDKTFSRTAGLVMCIGELLDRAESAAGGRHPFHRLRMNWWNGNYVEAAYRHLHRAEAEIAKLYDHERADSVIPEAVARLNSNLPIGDERREEAQELRALHDVQKALRLSRAIQIGHEAKDQSYAKIRRFRNILNCASALIVAFLAMFAALVSVYPQTVALCIAGPSGPGQICPAGMPGRGSSWDVWIVLLLGLLGGALAAAVSIRNIKGAPTPYNLATSLAVLKVPSGALTAVGGLILVNGHALPGISATLDSQQQILAYALVFGYGQQILTRLIDRRAGELATSIPTKTAEGGQPPSASRAAPV